MTSGLGAAQPHDALTAARFSLAVDGIEIASFQELSGIVTEVEPVDYISSSDREVIFKKLPGKAKPPTIILKRGMSVSHALWGWHETVRNGKIGEARKTATLTMYNTDGRPVVKYTLEDAWPSKLEVGGLRAGASEVLMETCTIVCEHLQRVSL